MIRVLVAEDELPLLRGISRLIESLGPDFRVIKMARTGKEAVDYLETAQVDVVFTDINMPVMDGLKVLRYVSENKPGTVMVVISGYQDFGYAQKALQYGVKNYLTKPVDKIELSALLDQIRKEYEAAETDRKRHLLEQIYYGNFSEGLEEVFSCDIFPLYFIVKAYSIQSMDEGTADLNVWRHCRPIEVIKALDAGVKGVYVFYGRNPNELLALVESSHKPNAESILWRMRENGKVSMPMAAAEGDALGDFKNMRENIGKVRRTLFQNWIYGRSGVVEENSASAPFTLPDTMDEALQYVIKNRQFTEFQQMVLDMKEQMRAQKITQYQLEQVLNKVMMYIWAYQNIFTGSDSGDVDYDINDMVVRADNLDDVFEEFLLLCHEIMFSENVEDTSVLMRKLDNYIQSHYKEQMNTKMLAGKFGLVPSYLSKLFQNYKGITPNHYIQKIRLEKAKEFLVGHPEMMAKDIAYLVGYTDPSYFSKVFKKSTGLYPSEYRTKNARG